MEIIIGGQSLVYNIYVGKLIFNGVWVVSLPFYWPKQKDWKIEITSIHIRMFLEARHSYKINFTPGEICVTVPSGPAFDGKRVFEGVAGNVGFNYTNELVCRDGSVFPAPASNLYLTEYSVWADATRCLDSWKEEMKTKKMNGKCIDGSHVVKDKNGKCYYSVCKPIENAINGIGIFAECKAMDTVDIKNFYNDCLMGICLDSNSKCDLFSAFASACAEIINTDIGDWRSSTGCAVLCPLNSAYSSCKSACPETCAEQGKTVCDKGCVEGCACLPGFVLDNTVSDRIKCIKKNDCGCTDMNGNWHRASSPFLTNNCQFINQCDNGTLVEKSHSCGRNSLCVVADAKMQCSCKYGFAGDGYNCKEITQTDEKKGVSNTCYPGWKYLKTTNKCYKNFSERKITWVEGKDICARNSAMPVSINIVEEHKFVVDQFGDDGSESSVSWIGLIGSAGKYNWIDGMEAEPKWNKYAAKKNECGQLILSSSGDVVDSDCSAQAPGIICEAFPIVSNVCES